MKRLVTLFAVSAFIFVGLVSRGPRAGAGVYPGTNGKIAFSVFSNDGNSADAFAIDPDGTNVAQLGPPGTTVCGGDNQAWSPDGSELVCAVFGSNGLPQPATVNADGSGFRLLSNAKFPPALVCDAWSPDGTRLVCRSYGDQPDGSVDRSLAGVYTVKADDSGMTHPETPPPGFTISNKPATYASASRIVFALMINPDTPDEQHLLYSMRSNGSDIRQLSPSDANVSDPGFFDAVSSDVSPDGSRVTFAAFLGATPAGTGLPALFVVNIDGTGLHQLTNPKTNPRAFSAQWSPNGRWVAFFGNAPTPNSFAETWLIHPDGTGLRQVTSQANGCAGMAPVWSPDGRKLLLMRQCYVGPTPTSTTLVTVNPDGSGISKVTDLDAPTSYAWGTARIG
jgi:Tol biopolymer transport system component